MEVTSLGDLTFESKAREVEVSETDLRVYGVDRTDGLTPEAKYTSKELARYKVLRPGMFAYNPMRLNIGSIAYCTDRHAVGLVSPDYVVFGCKPGALDPDFLSYAIKGPEWRRWTTAAGIGSVRVRIYFRELAKMPFVVPPLAEQKAIAAVLGALDDKIELNRRMNTTLDAMVRALFQSWFVDFDPVRAKLDDRKPVGLDEATTAFFPATFQDSPLGHIPLGWEIHNLSNLTEYLSRGIGPDYIEKGGICVLNQKCVREHRVDFSKSRRHDSAKKSADGRTLQLHDVLVNSTGMGTLGRVAQVLHLPETTIVDSHVTVVRADSETDPFFLGVNLTGREAEIEELGEGSTGQTELSRKRLGELKIITPPLEIQREFGTRVGSLLLRISKNETQSRTLATLRDTLLPKLLSGELSVASLESRLKAVA